MSYKREIEKKYLVINESWKEFASASIPICQAVISENDGVSVRVRTQGTHGSVNIKFVKGEWHTRDEFEYRISFSEAEKILDLSTTNKIEKLRWPVMHNGLFWEVDVFKGNNEGLIIAEIELESIEQEVVDLPEWVGDEVTADPRYYNINLAKNPYDKWID